MKRVLEKLGLGTVQPSDFDPATLGDPVALQTQWTPAARGGASFRTRRLVEADSARLEFRATTAALLFYLLFLGLGCGALAVAYLGMDTPGGARPGLEQLLTGGFGLVFAGAGLGMLRYGTTPLVFDRSRHLYWRGREAPDDGAPGSTRFETIHALQILSERVSTKNGSYLSYELNLVLHDGQRVNLVDHANHDAIRADAGTLAAFLAKPLWDAS